MSTLACHEEKREAFKRLAASGSLSHAYLFYGDKSIGKSTFARHLAFFLEGGKFEEPDGPLLDSRWFGPDEGGVIGIEVARGLKEYLSKTPFCSAKRMAVIDDAEALTPEAQGALLKIVEEPPPHALLIFIAAEPQILLPPLLSRLTKIYFSRLSVKEMEKFLIDKKGVSPLQARVVARHSFGRLGLAINLLVAEKEKVLPFSLSGELERLILKFREENIFKNSALLAWLLDREMLAGRYNLNPNLQKKAVEYKLSNFKPSL